MVIDRRDCAERVSAPGLAYGLAATGTRRRRAGRGDVIVRNPVPAVALRHGGEPVFVRAAQRWLGRCAIRCRQSLWAGLHRANGAAAHGAGGLLPTAARARVSNTERSDCSRCGGRPLVQRLERWRRAVAQRNRFRGDARDSGGEHRRRRRNDGRPAVPGREKRGRAHLPLRRCHHRRWPRDTAPLRRPFGQARRPRTGGGDADRRGAGHHATLP